ncbi:MAG: ADP-glyceromanno-heptose 6-epimerase [Flavobacteriia bacterium]|nr:ADP-glyceromanno-heptose 6-epimerase [Flavobacteriia bacterium]
MILLTGAAGFIGSVMLQNLNTENQEDIVILDNFSSSIKNKNFANKKFQIQVERTELDTFLDKNKTKISFVLHIGARTDTTEFDSKVFDKLNVQPSKLLWNFCVEQQIPMIYASSAATYGMGEWGYADSHELIPKLKALNPYGESKHEFDCWVLKQSKTPPFWAGLKFFNVYGPNEYHKGRMASVIFHAFHQIKNNGKVKLFRSHNPDFMDGCQKRDFVYVKDVVNVISFLMKGKAPSGIYNLGSGKARTFNDLVNSIFSTLKLESSIEYIDTPLDIRDKYQYFTEAKMEKLIQAGYTNSFYSLEEGVNDYVSNYLLKNEFY